VLKGYADHHVVFAIVQAPCTRGMDVMTAADRGQQEADDAELLADAFRNLVAAWLDAVAAGDLPKLLGLRKISKPGPFSPFTL
jgi:hypothetical protein